ncbi:hypothetical protein ACOSQ3_014316 [Xanthoceras sorbifolium]
MATGFRIPEVDDALKRLQEKKKKGKKKSKSSDVVKPLATPSHPLSFSRGKGLDQSFVGQKRKRDDLATGSEASVGISFPQDASTYFDFGSIMPRVERLLLPEDECCLKEMCCSQADWCLGHLFQALQSQIFTKRKLNMA